VFFPSSAGIETGQSTTGTFPVTKGIGSFPWDYWGTGVPGTIPYYFLAFLKFFLTLKFLAKAIDIASVIKKTMNFINNYNLNRYNYLSIDIYS